MFCEGKFLKKRNNSPFPVRAGRNEKKKKQKKASEKSAFKGSLKNLKFDFILFLFKKNN